MTCPLSCPARTNESFPSENGKSNGIRTARTDESDRRPGLLAFVVLYNLTNINITERSKEIATIKVLGFFEREVSAYVYRESIVLSLIGTACGLILGIFLHMFVIYNVEVDAVMFGHTIKPLSYLFAAALTMLFSALVNIVMKKKLRNISMVESMKAPE